MMSHKKVLVLVIVFLSVALICVLVFGGVQYEKFLRLYKAVMVATNDPKEQLVLLPNLEPVPGNTNSLLSHAVYAAQQFAKVPQQPLQLPSALQLLLYTSDAGLVLATSPGNLGALYILFRGTLFHHEWKKDFEFQQASSLFGVGRVHRGFQKMYMKYQPYIWKYLHQLKPTSVFVAGHSLGAALSLLTAVDLAKLGVPVYALLLAPPRVGDSDFVAAVEALPQLQVVQYVNQADLVPLIPLVVMPNAWVPKLPLYYDHVFKNKINTFYVNNKSWQNNHSLALHIAYIDNQTL